MNNLGAAFDAANPPKPTGDNASGQPQPQPPSPPEKRRMPKGYIVAGVLYLLLIALLIFTASAAKKAARQDAATIERLTAAFEKATGEADGVKAKMKEWPVSEKKLTELAEQMKSIKENMVSDKEIVTAFPSLDKLGGEGSGYFSGWKTRNDDFKWWVIKTDPKTRTQVAEMQSDRGKTSWVYDPDKKYMRRVYPTPNK